MMASTQTTARRIKLGVGAAALATALAASGVALGGTAAQAGPSASGTSGTQAALAASGTQSVKSIAAKTMSTNFRWADGKPVVAKVVSANSAKAVAKKDIKGRYAYAKKVDYTLGVLPDGRVLGMIQGRVVVVERNGKLRNYFSGRNIGTNGGVLVGTTFYATREKGTPNTFYPMYGPGKAIGKPFTPKLTYGWVNDLTVYKGRAYWTGVKVTGAYTGRLEVRSMSVKGGAYRVEAKDAANPQLVKGGIAVQTVAQKSDTTEPVVTGVRVLGGAKVLSVKGGLPQKQKYMALTSPIALSGTIVSVAEQGTLGQLVMDYGSKRAWFIKAPASKASFFTAAASGSRTAWSWESTGDPVVGRGRELIIFDTATGKLRKIKQRSPIFEVSLNGQAVGASTEVWQTGELRGVMGGVLK